MSFSNFFYSLISGKTPEEREFDNLKKYIEHKHKLTIQEEIDSTIYDGIHEATYCAMLATDYSKLAVELSKVAIKSMTKKDDMNKLQSYNEFLNESLSHLCAYNQQLKRYLNGPYNSVVLDAKKCVDCARGIIREAIQREFYLKNLKYEQSVLYVKNDIYGENKDMFKEVEKYDDPSLYAEIINKELMDGLIEEQKAQQEVKNI